MQIMRAKTPKPDPNLENRMKVFREAVKNGLFEKNARV